MTREEKLLKIKSLQEMIIQLKSNPSVESKKNYSITTTTN